MRVVICFPWRGGNPDRERAYGLVRSYYGLFDIPMFEGDSTLEGFSPARARNAAAEAAGDWDIAVFLDADCVIPFVNVWRGVEHARKTGCVTLPWDEFYSMTEEGHRLGYDTYIPVDDPEVEEVWRANSIGCERPLYSPGGSVIVPREVWDRVGGYDERFIGWGFEDAAFLVAAGEFDRLSGPQFHFWHPSSAFSVPTPDFWYREYRDVPVTQRLIDEGREMNRFGSWG